MTFQRIYLEALEEPAIGYAASSVFERAALDCPKCGQPVYARMRRGTKTPIGFTCAKCPWLSTYEVKHIGGAFDEQPLLFDAPLNAAPGPPR